MTAAPTTPSKPSCARRTTCRLCGGKNLDLALKLAPTPVADAYWPKERLKEPQEAFPLELFLCRDCHHAHLLDVVDPDILYRDYLYVTLTSLGLQEHFNAYAASVVERLKTPAGSLVVEFGSNDGTLLRAYQKRGMKALGIDPARQVAAEAAKSGVETLCDYFSSELAGKIRAERGAAAIVCANNVIANIDVLDDVMAGVRTLLAPDGVFIFESGYLLDTIKNKVFDNIYHEHISYHSVEPLVPFFKKHGLELIFVERVETKGGSLRGSVQLAGGPRRVGVSVAEFIKREKDFGLDNLSTYGRLSDELAATKKELNALLSKLKKEGKKVAGYGASHSVTTLLHHFDCARHLDYIVDDNPRKHNTYSPGHRVPVLPAPALYERRPDAVVILPWRFAAPIMKKHEALRAQGAQFIVPLPKLEVL